MDLVLDIQNLIVEFDIEAQSLRAVNDVTFTVGRGEVVGLVGESGCGKSVTALSIMRLIPSPPGRIHSGKIIFDSKKDLLSLPASEMRTLRGKDISMIFQEPMTALSPLHRVGSQLIETVQLHQNLSKKEAKEYSENWLAKVGIPAPGERMNSYPFELSGGMRQRVMIAMALMLSPKLIIADEPTTALDVTIQAQVLDLMLETKTRDASLLFITHDMGVIWEICTRVLVMYAAKIVEEAPVRDLFANPLHPYTQGLLKSMPILSQEEKKLNSIKGQVPSLLNLPKGCNFADRCPYVFDKCRQEEPPLFEFPGGRRSACFLSDQWLDIPKDKKTAS